MFARPPHILLLALVALAAMANNPAFGQRQRDCTYSNMGMIVADAILPADRTTYRSTPCRDEQCRAVRELTCAFDSYAHRLKPNSLAYVSPEAARRAGRHYARNIRAVGVENPSRIPLYCALLADIAKRLTGDVYHDEWVNTFVIDLTSRLTLYDRRCLPTVLAAWPRTEATRADVSYLHSCRRTPRRCISRNYGGPD